MKLLSKSRSKSSGVLVAFALCALTACAKPGAQEFAIFQASFDEAHQVGQLVLDKMAVSERKAFQNSRPAITPANVYFDPGEARYQADRIDPPATSGIRTSLAVVNSYTKTVSALATGESASAMAARVTDIGTKVTSLAVQLTTPMTKDQKTVVEKVNEKVKPLKALEPISTLGFGSLTQAEFRKTLLEQADTVDAILSEIIELTGNRANPVFVSKIQLDPNRACFESEQVSIFCLLIADMLFDRDEITGLKPFSAEDIKKIQALQALMANWVVLLENTRIALSAAVDAVESGKTGSSVAVLATITELENAAANVRAVLAEQ